MKKRSKKTEFNKVADFLYEAGILAKTPRSWGAFLGSGSQSVAEHLNRTCVIGFSLAELERQKGTVVDVGKVLQMCLFHDFSEARVSDLNYVHQKYVQADEKRAVKDFTEPLPFGKEIMEIMEEYEERGSFESVLAKEADRIELILSLKEQSDTGNTRAMTWIIPAVKRLKTDIGKKVADAILSTESDDWWYEDKEDEWWINRNHKKNKKD